MAAAEARAAWQKTADRCFVQEDAKRAPKLACCQSPSSSFKQFDSGPNNPSLLVCTKKAVEVEKREVKPLYGQVRQDSIDVLDLKEGYESMDIDGFDCKPVTKQSNEFEIDLDSPWIRVEKTTSWLRTTDIDDIVYLVSKKTHERIQNCDLPPPQKPCLRKYEHMRRPLVSNFDLKSQATTVCGQECVDSIVTQRKQEVLVGNSGNGSHKSFRCSNEKDNTGARQFSEGDTSKAELLEALRHSQTRAREAEKAAKQACAEKEHIVELFFKQASQLFAHRQWLRPLLQFDQSFHIQAKDEDQPFLEEGRKRRKNSETLSRRRRGKHGRPRHEIGKYSVAFAVGLSLVGAGLLLGWTVGWMFPSF